MSAALIVLAKRPVPGRVKTRLCPPLDAAQAADLASAALADTLQAVGATPARQRVLAFDGEPRDWLPDGWCAIRQPPGGLDERLATAFESVAGPALLIGMDTPQVTPGLLAQFDPARYDACLGLSPDGGFWSIGFADPRHAACIRGVPMSRNDTGAIQLARLVTAGLRVQLLPPLLDVDTFSSALDVAQRAPSSRFAATLTRLLEAAA